MIYKIKKGQKKGTIVLIHGNSSSARIFDPVFQVSKISYTIIAFNLPGHGNNKSGFEGIENFSISKFRNFCIQFINKIDDDILLAGNSFGGHIALEIAPKIKRLKGLVIFGTPPLKKPINPQEAYVPIKESQVFFKENPSKEEIENMVKVAVFNPEHAEIIISDFEATDPKVRGAIANDVINDAYSDEYKIFTQLEIPRYIIAGKQDASINISYLKDISAACKGNCELIEFNECGHYISLEQPERFSEALNNIAEFVFK